MTPGFTFHPFERDAGICDVGGCREPAAYALTRPRRGRPRFWAYRCTRHAWSLLVTHSKRVAP